MMQLHEHEAAQYHYTQADAVEKLERATALYEAISGILRRDEFVRKRKQAEIFHQNAKRCIRLSQHKRAEFWLNLARDNLPKETLDDFSEELTRTAKQLKDIVSILQQLKRLRGKSNIPIDAAKKAQMIRGLEEDLARLTAGSVDDAPNKAAPGAAADNRPRSRYLCF